jgi:hypothetical protein
MSRFPWLSRERLDRLCREILDPPGEKRAVGTGPASGSEKGPSLIYASLVLILPENQ